MVRVGDTVRRPPTFATQLMRDVLVHLEGGGFDAAPRWLGMHEQGRDVLSWIGGGTFSDWAIVWRDEQLTAAARLLRLYHGAVAGSALAEGREVVCHGDFGPLNLIWRDEGPFAVIDFDNPHPGDWIEDVAYALRAHLNLGLIETPPAEQARRARVFAHSYGRVLDIAAALERADDDAEARCIANGWARELAGLKSERIWLLENAKEF